MNTVNDAEAQHWDVIVIGTGMGGATAGHALAMAGKSVLFLERGKADPTYAPYDTPMPDTPAERIAMGRWPQLLEWWGGFGRVEEVRAELGCGVGGSTLFYAAALERFEPIDFVRESDACERPVWPIAYADFAPYYERAEQLYRARPLDPRDLTDVSEWDRELAASMRKRGLDPQRLNVGIAYGPDCTECVGEICRRRCKSDARTICIHPALENPRVQLVTECEVTHIEADRREANQVVATIGGAERRFVGKLVILAAGALHSPVVLLRSRSEHWPQGIGNDASLVGRNLMFHVLQVVSVFAPKKYNRKAPCKKALSLRDFYKVDGERLGTVQSMGIDVGAGLVAHFLKNEARKFPPGNHKVVQKLLSIPAKIGAALLGHACLFATLVEDMPSPHNRVVLDDRAPAGSHIEYTMTDDVRARSRRLRERFAEAIRPWRVAALAGAERPNFGHPCGTCRFGDDPATSVLDATCRVHGMSNLYVVDASFMPTSAATNPSLTVAANALRVAAAILAREAEEAGASTPAVAMPRAA